MAMVSVWRSMIESFLKRGALAEGELLAERGGSGRYSGVEAAARDGFVSYGNVGVALMILSWR